MDNDTGSEVLVDDLCLEQAANLHAVLDHYCGQIAAGGPFVKFVDDRKTTRQ